jgi:CRP-like cAMP-binding protein
MNFTDSNTKVSTDLYTKLMAGPGSVGTRQGLTTKADERFGNELLSRLTASDWAQIRARFQLVHFAGGETVYPADHLIDSVYFPLTAIASRLTVFEDGSTVEVGLIGRDGVIGLPAFMNNGLTRNWTVIDVAGTALRLRLGALRDGMEHLPSLAQAVSAYYQEFFVQVTRRAVCRSRHTITEQLCSWLLMVRDRSDSAELPLTQETIARRMGSRRAGITVAANALKKAGAITYCRGRITIADRALLCELACECYPTVSCREHEGGPWTRPGSFPLLAIRRPTAA